MGGKLWADFHAAGSTFPCLWRSRLYGPLLTDHRPPMPTVYVTRKAHFNAAHRLHNPARSDAWNEATFGKCNSPHWHGHNYELDVTVAGEPDPDTGFVVDLAELKRVVESRVVDALDHRNLNLDVPFLAGLMTSTESLAVAVWKQLEGHVPGPGRLHEIVLRETPNNSVVYRGE